MGRLLADEILKIEKTAEPLCGDEVFARFEIINLKRHEVSQEEIDNANHIIATIKEIPGVKIAADNTDSDQYALAMAMGYVPARDMFYDTVYESRPGSSRLEREAGYIMAEKLLEMGR